MNGSFVTPVPRWIGFLEPTFRRLVKKEDNIFDKEHQKTGESIAFHGLNWQFA